MATRTPKLNGHNQSLQAAAIELIDKGQNTLLYNTQVIDFLTNNVQSGNTDLAWHFWSKIPELRYTTRYISNALSVTNLFIGEVDSSGNPPKRLPENHPASDLLEDFAGGFAGQSELLDRLALHLTVAGDSVLIGPKAGSKTLEPPYDQWRVYSTDEVSARSGKIYLKFPGNSREQVIPDGVLAVRIWRPHPRLWWDSDSPVKGSFSVLRELDLLDQHVHATAISRLAGAGLWLIPDEIDLPTSDMETEGTETDRFIALLTEVMGIAIKNRESASALIPIMLRGPAEYLDKFTHIDFSTAFSEQVPELRTGAVRRLALGMDVPPEILLGSSQSTSWSAWQTDESTLRVHLIPMLQLIASSLTVGWLRPALEELPLSQAQKDQIPNLVVHYDYSNLKIRQDVSGDAEAMYDRMEIDAEALRRATGFGPDSIPSNEELAKQILMSLVRGSNPQMVPYAVKALKDNFGLTLLPDPPAEGGAEAGSPPVEGEAVEEVTEEVVEPGPGRPGSAAPLPEVPDLSGPLPGKRSQAKELGLPPVPKIGDNSNNSIK